MTLSQRQPREPQITSAERATKLIDDLDGAMDDLLAVLHEETSLVRRGELRKARDLATTKNDLAAAYTRLMLLARDEVVALGRYLPKRTDDLKRRHELFRAEVQINLAVLATARDVAEDLIRQVANDMAPPAVAGYGQSGRSHRAPAAASHGFVLNRNY